MDSVREMEFSEYSYKRKGEAFAKIKPWDDFLLKVAPTKSGEGAAWNEEEYDVSVGNRMRFAARGVLGDGALPGDSVCYFENEAVFVATHLG